MTSCGTIRPDVYAQSMTSLKWFMYTTLTHLHCQHAETIQFMGNIPQAAIIDVLMYGHV